MMLKKKYNLFALIILLLACVDCVAKAVNVKAPVSVTENTMTSGMTHVFLGLIFVLAIIVIAAWLLKRFTGLNFQANQTLQCLSAVSVGTRERIVLIQAGDQQLLVGITPHTIQCLHTFDEKIEMDESVKSENFMQHLRKAMKKESGQ